MFFYIFPDNCHTSLTAVETVFSWNSHKPNNLLLKGNFCVIKICLLSFNKLITNSRNEFNLPFYFPMTYT